MRIRALSAAALLALLVISLAGRGARSEPAPVADALHARAAALGSVRVVVRLNTPFVPEGRLATSAHVQSQRQTLASSQSIVRGQLRHLPHRVVRDFGSTLPLLALEASPAALQVLGSLRGLIAEVQEDRLSAPGLAQSIPLIKADGVWSAGFDGTGLIVAILDTGVQKDHGFFAGGKVVAEACFSSNFAPHGATSLCPGGLEFSAAPGSGMPCTESSCGHGTHVAGTAAGAGTTFSGVARGARIIAIQVFSRFPGSFCGTAAPCVLSYDSDQAAALNYLHAQRLIFPGQRIAAANMSLAGGASLSPCNSAVQKPAIDQLRAPHPGDPLGDPGVATVIAAGNNGFTDAISAPACIESAIPVASSTKANAVSSFSNLASPAIFPGLLIAPGSSINAPVTPGPNTFGVLSGTSMAAPHVAGALALLRQIEPTASVDALLGLLKASGQPITDTRTPCAFCGGGFSVPRIDVLAATASLAPSNLVVQTLTAPAAGVPGSSVNVTVSVRNTGIGSAAASTLKLYLSTDNVITAGDVLLGSLPIPALGGGVSSPATTVSLPIPAGTAPGTYFIGALADADEEVAESNEADNTKAAGPIQIVLADLAVTAVSAMPALSAPGQSVSVSHTVKNLATAPGHAPASTSRLYLSSDAQFGGDVPLDTVAVPALTAGASITVTKSVTIPASTPAGLYWIFAAANDDQPFPEPSTSNNALGTATPLVLGADLVVTAASASPASPAPGMNVNVTHTVRNQGGAAAGAFDVGIYLSADGVVDGGDTLLGVRRVTGLGAGAASTATTGVTIPATAAAGAQFLIVRADITGAGAGEVVEADEGNNARATGTVQVVRPDLTVTAVTAPGVGAPGGSLSVSHVVRNVAAGAGWAPGTTSRVYLSTDATLQVGSDVLLGEATVPALWGGTQTTVTTAVTIPGGTAPGLYWVVAQANASGAVQEVDSPGLANNVKATAGPIIVGADLVVTALTTSTRLASPGVALPLTTTVRNQGGQSAPSSAVKFYLGTTGTLSGSPIPLGAAVTPALLPSTNATLTTSLTVPADMPAGSYFVLAEADGDSPVVPEADETNNVRATTFTINLQLPNLQVVSIVPPTAAIRGRTAGAPTAFVVVRNTGPGPAAPFSVELFANHDDGSVGAAHPGAGDVIFTRAVPVLGPAAQTTLSGPLVVPEIVGAEVRPAGNYYLSAVADAAGLTMDPSPADNALTWTAKRVAVLPDMTKLTSAAVTLALQPACAVPALALAGPFAVTSQTLANPSTWFGTGILADTLGSGIVQRYNVTGTVQAVDAVGIAGKVQATFSYTAIAGSPLPSSGSGAVSGAAPGLDLAAASIGGTQSGLPACTFAGAIDLVR